MAKYEIKFLDCEDETMIETWVDNGAVKIIVSNNLYISIINLDKSTAIKFAKTLRTEINKIDEI